MAVLTIGAVAVIATGGVAAAAGGAAGIASGFASGGTAATVGSSIAAAAGGGSVAGAGTVVTAAASGGAAATAGATAAAAATGAAVGGASSAGYTAMVAGLATGPVGWCALGTDGVTMDCWKPVLRDESKEPSKGRLLKDIVTDFRVKNVTVYHGEKDCFIIENIWGEHFIVSFLYLPSGQLAAHASAFEMLPLMPK